MTDTTNLSERMCVVSTTLALTSTARAWTASRPKMTAASISGAGSQVTAHLVDVSDLNVAAGLVKTALEEHDGLGCATKFAGTLRDGYATNQSAENWMRSSASTSAVTSRCSGPCPDAGGGGRRGGPQTPALVRRGNEPGVVIGTSASSNTRGQRPAFPGSPGRPPRRSSTWVSESAPCCPQGSCCMQDSRSESRTPVLFSIEINRSHIFVTYRQRTSSLMLSVLFT